MQMNSSNCEKKDVSKKRKWSSQFFAANSHDDKHHCMVLNIMITTWEILLNSSAIYHPYKHGPKRYSYEICQRIIQL